MSGEVEPVLLAIDTAIGSGVALGGADPIVAADENPRGHAEAIGVLLAQVFERSGRAPADVTGVVVGVGPGPFTGLRVGIAAAHAFALGQDIPLLPQQGHEAVALEHLKTSPEASLRVVHDAKRRELFVTEFSGLDAHGLPIRIAEPRLLPRAEYVAEPSDIWPERIPVDLLIELAQRRLRASRPFEPEQARYLRQPDATMPAAPKRVST